MSFPCVPSDRFVQVYLLSSLIPILSSFLCTPLLHPYNIILVFNSRNFVSSVVVFLASMRGVGNCNEHVVARAVNNLITVVQWALTIEAIDLPRR